MCSNLDLIYGSSSILLVVVTMGGTTLAWEEHSTLWISDPPWAWLMPGPRVLDQVSKLIQVKERPPAPVGGIFRSPDHVGDRGRSYLNIFPNNVRVESDQ